MEFNKFRLVIVALLLSLSMHSEARRGPQSVDPSTRTYLNQVLELANQIHSALFSNDFSKMDESITQLLGVTGEAKQRLSKKDRGKFFYLSEVLSSIRKTLIRWEITPEEKKQESLRAVFNDVVQIARNYKLDKYRLFFCSKDP